MFIKGRFSSPTTALASLLSMALGLILVQSLFFYMQAGAFETASNAVQSVLRLEANQSNLFMISRSLEEFQAIGIFKCATLKDKKTGGLILDLNQGKDCETNFLGLQGKRSTIEQRSLNGTIWEITLLASNGVYFYISLWLARLTVCIALLLVTFHFNVRFAKISAAFDLQLAKAEMAQQVAHDIRGPVTALSMVAGRLSPQFFEEAELLRTATSRILETAEGLLASNRPKPRAELPTLASQKKICTRELPQASSIELVKLISISRDLQIAQTSQTKNIRISIFNNLEQTERLLRFDPSKMAAIVSNLLSNSVDAIEASGFVSITLDWLERDCVMEVRDSGAGIDEKIIPRIGERLLTTKESTGTGLGLYSATRSIKEWGGSIEFQSPSRRGTKVRIQIRSV